MGNVYTAVETVHVRVSSIKTIHIELLNWAIVHSGSPERKNMNKEKWIPLESELPTAWMPRHVPKPYNPGNEQLPGQMSVRDIPGVVPEGGK